MPPVPNVPPHKLSLLAKLSGGMAVLVWVAVAMSGGAGDFKNQSLLAAAFTFASGATISIDATPATIFEGTVSTINWNSAGEMQGSCSIDASPSFDSANYSDPTNIYTTGNVLPSVLYIANLLTVGNTMYLIGGGTPTLGKTIYSASVSNPMSWANTGKTFPVPIAFNQIFTIGNTMYSFQGSDSNGNAITTIYSAPVSDPTTWTSTGKTIPAPISYSAMTIAGNNIYMYGGRNSSSFNYVNTIYVASTSNPTQWVNTGKTLPQNESGSLIYNDGSYIYILGGIVNTKIFRAPVSDPTAFVDTNKVVPGGPFSALTSATLAQIGNTLYIYTTAGIYTASTLDPTTWTSVNKIPPNGGAYPQVIGNKVYFFGGTTINAAGNLVYENRIFTSAPGADASVWTNTSASMPVASVDSQYAVIGDNIYRFGGSGSKTIYAASTSNPTVWINTGKTLPGTLSESQLGVVGDNLFLFGGDTGGGAGKVIYAASTSNPTVWINTNKLLPGNLSNSQLITIGDNLFLFGGDKGNGNSGDAVNKIYAASTSNPTIWIDTNKVLPGVVAQGQFAVIGDKIYSFGGGNYSASFRSIYVASTANPTVWTDTGALIPDDRRAGQLLISNDIIYLIGGVRSTFPAQAIFAAPVSNPTAWYSTGKNIPAVGAYEGIVLVNNAAYFLGGSGNAIYVAPISTGLPFGSFAVNPWKSDGGGNLATTWPITEDTTYTLTCNDKTGTPGSVATTVRVYPKPILSLTANLIHATSTVTWSSQYATACAVNGPGLVPTLGLSGSLQTKPTQDPAVYKLTCQTPVSDVSKSVTATDAWYYAAIKGLPSFGNSMAYQANTDASNAVLNGWPAPLACMYPNNLDACLQRSENYFNTLGVFSVYDPANPSNGSVSYFKSKTTQGRLNINYDGSAAWTNTVVPAAPISVPAGKAITLEWACTPNQNQDFLQPCWIWSQCGTQNYVALFGSASSTKFSTGGSPKNYLTMSAPNTPTTYTLQCRLGGAGSVAGPALSILVTPNAINLPTAKIEANSSGYGTPVSIVIGTPVNLHALFTVGAGDTADRTSIVDTDLLKMPDVSETPPDLNKTSIFSTTTPGMYTFYPSIKTLSFNTWNNYGGEVDVTVMCPANDPHGAGPNCSQCEAGYAKDGGGICQVDSCIDITGLQPSVPPHSDPNAATTGRCLPCASGYTWDGSMCTNTAAATPTINSFAASRARSGGPSTLSWNISGLVSGTSCNIAPASKLASVPSFTSGAGSVQTTAIIQPTAFTLACGNGTATTTRSATATLIPTFQEI